MKKSALIPLIVMLVSGALACLYCMRNDLRVFLAMIVIFGTMTVFYSVTKFIFSISERISREIEEKEIIKREAAIIRAQEEQRRYEEEEAAAREAELAANLTGNGDEFGEPGYEFGGYYDEPDEIDQSAADYGF